MNPPSDNELMDRVRDGDLAQLAHLFDRYRVKLYNFYLRLTHNRTLSEDLVQEVFLRVLKYRHTFRGDGEFAVWMYYIARNARRDHYAKWRYEQPGEQDQQEPHATDPSAQDLLERDQSTRLLQEALMRLPEEKRELLILSRYQDLRYDAIAEILGCSVDAVKVRVHRAINDLRTIYEGLSGEKTR